MARESSLFSGRPSELIGRQVAGYRIEREIGRGGMAVVYRARDLRLERTVAPMAISAASTAARACTQP